MYLKSPDPTAHAVIGGERLYPVREGIFLIDDEDAGLFSGYEFADEIPEGVAEELQELEVHDHPSDAPEIVPGMDAPAGHSDLPRPDASDEQLEQAVARIADLEQAGAAALAEVADLAGKNAELEQQLDEANARIAELEQQLENGGDGETPEDEGDAVPSVDELMKHNRPDLNAKAAEFGVDDPEKFADKRTLSEAIAAKAAEAAEAAQQ